MLKKLITTILIFQVFSCGFQVIYKKETSSNSKISQLEELASIRIQKDRKRIAQELKNHLYDILNPEHIKVEAKYFLILEVKEVTAPTFITTTGASGRNKITLNISYQLKDLETAKIISSGSTSVNDDYDVSESRYGTYSAKNYIMSNLAKTAAQNIRNYLVNDLIEMKQNTKDIEN